MLKEQKKNIYIQYDLCNTFAETLMSASCWHRRDLARPSPRYCVEHGTLAPELHSHTVKKYVRLLKKARWRRTAWSTGSFPNGFFHAPGHNRKHPTKYKKHCETSLHFSKYVECDLTSVLRRMQPGEKQLTCQGVIAPAKKRHHLPKAA